MSLLSWTAARDLAQKCQAAGGLVVTTNGGFDILHPGHVTYLQAARQLGDLLFVGLNSDISIRATKGPMRPVNSEDARAIVLAALRCVDGVCLFSEATPNEWLSMVRPNIHVKGGDWDPKKMPETPLVESLGGKVVVIPYVDGFSTTKIIEKSQGIK